MNPETFIPEFYRFHFWDSLAAEINKSDYYCNWFCGANSAESHFGLFR